MALGSTAPLCYTGIALPADTILRERAFSSFQILSLFPRMNGQFFSLSSNTHTRKYSPPYTYQEQTLKCVCVGGCARVCVCVRGVYMKRGIASNFAIWVEISMSYLDSLVPLIVTIDVTTSPSYFFSLLLLLLLILPHLISVLFSPSFIFVLLCFLVYCLLFVFIRSTRGTTRWIFIFHFYNDLHVFSLVSTNL